MGCSRRGWGPVVLAAALLVSSALSSCGAYRHQSDVDNDPRGQSGLYYHQTFSAGSSHDDEEVLKERDLGVAADGETLPQERDLGEGAEDETLPRERDLGDGESDESLGETSRDHAADVEVVPAPDP